MAWITQINYTLLYSSIYCIYFYQNFYIFCLLRYNNSNAFISLELHEFRYFYDWICGYSVRGRPLASSMNEKDITTAPPPRFHRKDLNLVLDWNVTLSGFNWNKLALTDPKIYQCLCFVSRCTPVMFFSKHVYKKLLKCPNWTMI